VHNTSAPLRQQFCFDANVSVCDVVGNSKQFTITVYNQLAHDVDEYIRVPLLNAHASMVYVHTDNRVYDVDMEVG
jgi:hypothetical protein